MELGIIVVAAIALLIVAIGGLSMAFDSTGAYPECKEDGCRQLVEYPPDTDGYCDTHAN